MIAVSLVFRVFNDNALIHKHHTLSCIGDMAVGAFGAWLVNQFFVIKTYFINVSKWQISLIYLSFFTIFFLRYELLFGLYGIRIVERSFIAVIILLIILEQNYAKNSFFKLSRFVFISKLGLISYVLYCLHKLAILITVNATKILGFNIEKWQVIILETSIAVALTVVNAKLSYKYFEAPFLKLKNKYSLITK